MDARAASRPRGPHAPPSPFGHLVIHLLDRCNLACRHCYLKASPHGRQRLSLPVVLSALDDCERLGIKSIQLTGGEPLLHPDFDRILVAAAGGDRSVTVSTNAMRVTDSIADQMAASGAHAVVSIDGPEAYHDAFRGQAGSFRKAEAGIDKLVNRGVPVKVVMTVCAGNIDDVDWCADWAVDANVDTLQIQPLEAFGRGHDIDAEKLTPEQLNRLFIRLSDLAVACGRKGLNVGLAFQSRDRMLEHPCLAYVCNGRLCHRGVAREVKKLVIREDGRILPELMDMDPRFAFGNLNDQGLHDTLRASFDEKYALFDGLCREVFADTVPSYPSPLIPWNEILAQRSWLYAA